MKIFITGVSSGIGKALTIKLIEEKHKVWGIARRQKMLEKLGQELASENLRLTPCNVENLAEMRSLANEMRKSNFIPDIIVLNAGVHLQNPLNTFDFDLYQKTFDINLRGTMFWVAEFIPDYIIRNSGHFVAICSTSAFRYGYGGISYSASKAAVALTFRRLRAHFAKTRIKFSTLYFGPIDTKLFRWPKIKLFVPSADCTAQYIAKIIKKNGGEYYFPFFTTSLSRLSTLLPESLFIFISKYLTDKHGGD